MPDALTWDQIKKLNGIAEEKPAERSAAGKRSLDWEQIKRLNGIGVPTKEPEPESDSYIGTIIKNALAETTYGIAARATGVVDYEPKSVGAVGDIASGIGSFILDAPTLAVTGGVGGILAKQAAKKLVARGIEKGFAAKAIPAAVHAGTLLGGQEAAHQVAGSEFRPGEIAQATIAGAAFGPAGLIKQPIVRTAAEVATMGAVPPLLEGRFADKNDWINAAGTVGGFKLAHAIKRVVWPEKPAEARAAVEKEVGPENAQKIEEELARLQPRPERTGVLTPANATKEEILSFSGAKMLLDANPDVASHVSSGTPSRSRFTSLREAAPYAQVEKWSEGERAQFVSLLQAYERPPLTAEAARLSIARETRTAEKTLQEQADVEVQGQEGVRPQAPQEVQAEAQKGEVGDVLGPPVRPGPNAEEVARERLAVAQKEFNKYKRQRGYGAKTTRAVTDADAEFQRLAGEVQAAQRSVSGIEAGQTRAARATTAKAPQTPEETVVYLPLHTLPEPVAVALQTEAALQLEAKGIKGKSRITGVKAREALQKIVRDKGEDVGSEVQKQKRRLLEYLNGDKDFRTIYEKDIGVPKRDPDAIVDSYLKGASEEQIARIAAELKYEPTTDLPDWVTQRQPGEVETTQRPGLFGQETFDPVTGRQAELPLAALPERAAPDVTGQGVLPVTPAEQARARASESWAAVEAQKRKNPTLFSTGTDPEMLRLVAVAFKNSIVAGVYDFREWVARLARQFGTETVRAYRAVVRDVWERERAADKRFGEPGDVDRILAETRDLPERPTVEARPDLSKPVPAEVQPILNVADTIRNAAEEPRRLPDPVVQAEADRRIAENGPALRAKFLAGGWVPSADGIDTKVQQKLLTLEAQHAFETRRPEDYKNAVDMAVEHRQGRSSVARELRQGAIQASSSEEQKILFSQDALLAPPEHIERKIVAARERAQRIRREAPRPAVHPLRPDEIAQPEGRMAAPEGFRGEPKAKVQGPESESGYQTRLRRAEKKADDLAQQWANEIERIRGALAAKGHNVDAALRGELDKVAQQEFIRDAHAIKASIPDKLYEWWNNVILSGIPTETTNAIGNVAHAAWYFTAEKMSDAFVSSIARGLGYGNEGAYFGELKHAARAIVPNLGKAWKNFYETWRTETPQFYLQRGLELKGPGGTTAGIGFRRPAILGRKSKLIPKWLGSDTGQLVRSPWRLLSAVDDAVKTLVAEMETASLAYRQAKLEGLSGKALTRRMDQLIADQMSEAHQRGTDTAIRLAFQEQTPVLKAIGGAVHAIPGGRYILPFVTTPFNILKTGVRKSPFGAVKLAQEVVKAQRSGDWSHVHPRVAEQVLAWGATMALAYMNDPADPFITGGEDKNRPYSVKIGGTWWSYGRLEPFATTLGLLVDGINKIHQGADAFEALKAPFDALLKRVDNQTFFAGIGDILKAVQYQDANYVLNYASKFPSSWVPNLVRSSLRAADENVPQRRVWGKGAERAERMLNRGLQSFEVMPDYPRYDFWGRPVPKDSSPIPNTDWLWRTLFAGGPRSYVETMGDRMLTRWNGAHPDDRAEFKVPNPYFSEDGKEQYFTDPEYATYVRESGRLTQQRMIAAHARKPFNINEPTAKDIERLRKIIERSRTQIRNSIKRARRKAERAAA